MNKLIKGPSHAHLNIQNKYDYNEEEGNKNLILMKSVDSVVSALHF